MCGVNHARRDETWKGFALTELTPPSCGSLILQGTSEVNLNLETDGSGMLLTPIYTHISHKIALLENAST